MRQMVVAIKAFLGFTLLTGVLYPILVTFVGRLAFLAKANGSLVEQNGTVVGSELLAQSFSSPSYFWPRPSAVKYDATNSGASNLSVTSSELLKAIHEREAQGLVGDLKFASGSGLDPHISEEAALSQVDRVAQERKLGEGKKAELLKIVQESTEQRQFGLFGEKRVNVLLLNLKIDSRFKQ